MQGGRDGNRASCCTASTLAPADTASEAQVCRKSCGVIRRDRPPEPPVRRLRAWQIATVTATEHQLTGSLAPALARHAVSPTKGRKPRSLPVPTFVLDQLRAHVLGRSYPRIVASQIFFPLLGNDVIGKLSGGYTPYWLSGDSICVVIYLTNRAIVCPSHAR